MYNSRNIGHRAAITSTEMKVTFGQENLILYSAIDWATIHLIISILSNQGM